VTVPPGVPVLPAVASATVTRKETLPPAVTVVPVPLPLAVRAVVVAAAVTVCVIGGDVAPALLESPL
jgi:hypothetical protein